jgi:hypothetical protein
LPSLPSPSCESPSSQSLLLRDALCGLGEYNFPAVVLVLLLRGFPEYGRLTNPMSYASLHCVPYKSFPTLSEPTVTKHSNDFITVFTSLPSVHVLHYNLFSTYVFLLLLPLFSSYTNLRFGTYILILKNVLTDSSVGIGWNSPKTYVPCTTLPHWIFSLAGDRPQGYSLSQQQPGVLQWERESGRHGPCTAHLYRTWIHHSEDMILLGPPRCSIQQSTKSINGTLRASY